LPCYEYQCSYGHVTERILKHDIEWILCNECGHKAGKIISAPSRPQFKGRGFYETDYKAPGDAE
jgi:putative FmdB family regulatory protein